ncbi:EAL domain-containing protein [Acidithiobacillus caldus]
MSDESIIGHELLAGETHCPKVGLDGWQRFYRFLVGKVPKILEQTGKCLFVNAHGEQLVDSVIADCLDSMPCKSGRLVLEWTEQSFREESLPDILTSLAQKKKNGWKIAVDDIGAGVDGMGRTVACKPAFGKMDHVLLHRARESEKEYLHIQDMINALQSQDIEAIVEGVETESDLRIAKQTGAAYAQGWLFL